MINKIPSVIIRLYYILILLTPWIMYSGTSELFEFNKIIFIYIVTTLIFVFMGLDFLSRRRPIKHSLFFSITILVFLLSQILSWYFSMDRHTSFEGYYGRFNGGLLSIITYIILFFGFLQYFDFRSVRTFLKISIISSVGVILWGLPGRYGHDLSCLVFTGAFNNTCWTDQFRPAERMFSTLGQPNWLGAYLAIHFFIGIYFMLSSLLKKMKKTSIVYALYILLVFCGILFTRSRSSLLSIAVPCVFLPGLLYIVGIKNLTDTFWRKIIILLGVGFIISILIIKTGVPKIDNLITFKNDNPATTVATNAEPVARPDAGVTDSLDIRKIVWKGALELGRRYPLFGTGIETFAYSYYFVRPQEHNLTSEWDFLYNKAHNEFLNYLATTGYIGFGAYVVLIASVFVLVVLGVKKTLKEKDSDGAIFVFLLGLSYMTIHITNFFGFSTSTIQLFFYLIPALVLLAEMPKKNAKVEHKKIGGWIVNLSRGAVLAVGLFSLMYIIGMYRADLEYAYSDRLIRAGDFESAASLYTGILDYHYEHVYEDKLSYILANLAYNLNKSGEKETVARIVKLSRYYNLHSRQESQDNVLYLKTAIKNAYLYYQLDQDPAVIRDSLGLFEEGKRIAPTDPKIPYSAALFYSLLEDEEKNKEEKVVLANKSLDEIQSAIALKNNYYDGYFLKAQLLKKYGKRKEAKELFEYILKTFGPDNEEVKKEIQSLS